MMNSDGGSASRANGDTTMAQQFPALDDKHIALIGLPMATGT